MEWTGGAGRILYYYCVPVGDGGEADARGSNRLQNGAVAAL